MSETTQTSPPSDISSRLVALIADVRAETETTKIAESEITRLKGQNAALETEVCVLRAIKNGTQTICSCKTAQQLEQQIDVLRKQIKVMERKNALLEQR